MGDPLNEVGRVLGLDVKHLLLDLFGGHTTTEDGDDGQVTATARIAGGHHVLVVEHLAGEFGDGQSTVDLAAAGSQWGETTDVEVHTWEWLQVNVQLTEIGVELTRETQAGSDTRHDQGDEVVQVTIGRAGKLQSTEADIVQGLIVNAENFVSRLDELVDREGAVVRLDDSVGHLGAWNDGEGGEDTVGVLLTELGEKKGTHTRTSTTTEGVDELEALKAVAGLSLLTDGVENGVDELSALSVVALGPVVTGTGLTEHEVVRAEELTEGTGTDGVHGTRLKVNQDGTGDITATSSLVVVNVDALDLELRVTAILTAGVNTVLV